MALDRLCCPRRAAPVALGSAGRTLPAVASSSAARRLTVGHSKRLMMDRFRFTSFRIMAITWTAFKEVPPASKKLTFRPIPGRPRTFLHILRITVSSQPDGSVSATSSRPPVRSRNSSIAFATRLMLYSSSPIRWRCSDRADMPNPNAGGSGDFSPLAVAGSLVPLSSLFVRIVLEARQVFGGKEPGLACLTSKLIAEATDELPGGQIFSPSAGR